MAPVAASGATALSEAGTESWRWGMFSTGTVVGLLFGFLYVAVPVVTGTLFGHAFEIFPIPFADFTSRIETVLPAAVVGLSFNLANLLTGFVLPFEIVAGAAAAERARDGGGEPPPRPLRDAAALRAGRRRADDKALGRHGLSGLSIGIGVNLSVAIIGIGLVVRAALGARQQQAGGALHPRAAGEGPG